jgi:hypothetical protein
MAPNISRRKCELRKFSRDAKGKMTAGISSQIALLNGLSCSDFEDD